MSSAETSWLQGTFNGFDNQPLHYRYFPRRNARQTLILIHGHGEHSGRYEKFADFLKELPLNLAIYDVRGHGLSAGEHVYVEAFENYLADVTAFTECLSTQHSLRNPFLLFGHSTGGLVAAHWAIQNPSRVKGLFLSSPFLGLNAPAPLRALNSFLNRVAPHFVYQNPVYPPHLTHNPDEVDHYKRDMLIRRKITVRLISEVIKYQNSLQEMKTISLPFPVYILMAGLDRVVRPEATRSFFERLTVPDKGLKVFEGFYHEIFNELGQEKVFEAFAGFLKRVLEKF